MNNQNNFFAPRRTSATRRWKRRKLTTSLIIPNVQKDTFEHFFNVPTQPTITPSGEIGDKKYMDQLQAILSSEKGHGDPDDTDFADLIHEPVFQAVTMFIYSIGTYRGIPAYIIFNHFIIEAYAESHLKVGAANKRSSAKGYLQILRGTYPEVVKKGLNTIASSSSVFAVAGRALLYRAKAADLSWSNYNHDHPARDLSQAYAIIGQLYSLLDQISKQWIYDTKVGWVPRIRTKSALTFSKAYAGLLHDLNPGRQVLITAMHTNGLYIFTKEDIYVPTYEKRLFSDWNAMRNIQGSPQFFNSYVTVVLAQFQGLMNTKIFGDVAIEISPINNANPYAINAAIAQKFNLNTALAPAGTAFVTSKYGMRKLSHKKRRMHEGIDLRARKPLPIFAVATGEIVHQDDGGSGYGRNIVLRTPNGRAYRYAHLSKVFVRGGMQVVKGQILGLTGSTETTVPHLHFEYYANPSSTNPGNDIDPLQDPTSAWKYAVNSI